MKTKQLLKVLILLPLFTSTFAQDWQNVPIPANPGTGKVWKIQNQHSDDFNYNGKNSTFSSKWLDNHRAGWSGPGETQFSANHSAVTGGNLQIKAGRVTNIQGKTTFCGHVTTKTPVVYPVFTEVRMKCSGINLSSNFWLLSADDVNEIDVTETYGAEDFAGRRMATNYHIFQRSPFLDLANSPKNYASNGNVLLKNDYHRFGLYWKSATEFEFYFDGVLVRTLNRSNDLKDPRNRFFDQAMHLILNTELHSWKSNAGIRPSNAELNNNSINTLYFDWIRTYKPVVDATNNTAIPDGVYYIKKASSNTFLKATAALGNTTSVSSNSGQATQWKFTKVGNNEYSINSVAYPAGRLEVPFGKKERGVKIATTSWAGSATHIIWRAEKVGNNYIFIPKHDPLRALDIWEGNSTVHTWDKNTGNANQVISLISITEGSNGGGTLNPITKTLSPIQDTYLQGVVNQNNTILRVEPGKRTSYLKFDLNEIEGTIIDAKLKMTCNGDSGNGTITINHSTNDAWTETTLNNTNKPLINNQLGSLTSTFSIGSNYTWNLEKDVLNTGKNINMVVTQTTGDDVAFASKENTVTGPQLVITYTPSSSNRAVMAKDSAISTALAVFPNPVRNMLYLREIPKEKTQFRVMSLKGESQSIEITNTNALDVSKLLPGVYVLQMVEATNKQEIKFVKE